MGMWGFEPWEDDLAADWFADLFNKGKIADRVERTLRKEDVEEYWPEVRAAAYVVAVLGDVWPHDKRKAHHELAIAKLEAVKGTREFEGDDGMAAEIDAQIAVLRARLAEAVPVTVEAKLPPKYDPAKALADLKSPDAAVRKAGAVWLVKHAFGGANRWTEDWLKDPTTTEALLPVLDDPDPEVAEKAITAVRGLLFHHKDVRALSGAVRLMASDRPQARLQAALVAMQLDAERCLDGLLRLFGDKDKKVRAAVISEIGHAREEWSPAARERLRQAALKVLGDRTPDVRCAAATLLVHVGSRADVPAIKKAKAQTKGAGWQQEFREILQRIEGK